MKNPIEKISFAILVIFALIGTIFAGTIIHELSHWNDFKDIAENDNICIIEMPADGLSSITDIRGTYTYQISEENKEQAASISRYTELKAYSVQFATTILLFLVSTVIVYYNRN